MRPSPASARALEYLRRTLAAAQGAEPRRLPTIPVLASQAGVAPVTMWKAVRQLASQGVLDARPRSGIRAGPAADAGVPGGAVSGSMAHRPSGRPSQRWQRVRDTLESEITGGEFMPGDRLPGTKILVQRYGVCHQTLRKALAALERERVLVARHRAFRVADPAPRPGSSTVFFVDWVSGAEVLEALETECSRLGVRLQTVRFIPQERLFEALAAARRGQGGEAVIGFLVSITGGSPAQYRRVLEEIVPVQKPVAVLDQTGGATGVALPGGRVLRVFTIAQTRMPGQRMGRHLLSLGHRTVAFLSAAHEETWSSGRLEGLRDVFSRAGSRNRVLEFTARHAAPADEARRAEADLSWLLGTALGRDRPRHRRLARCIRRLDSEISAAMRWSYVEDALAPLMEQALATPGVSAWVAANDPMALTCLEFLRARGVRVPEDISVAGFDDLTAAYSAGLTSYNFNRQAAVRAVVSHLVSGVQPRSDRGGSTVEIEGFVTPRATTGQAGAGR